MQQNTFHHATERGKCLIGNSFTVTMMPNTLSVHYKHIGIEKHTPENYQSWIVLPRAQISTLLTQCGIVLTENDAKGSKHPEKSFECPLNKPGELLLKR